MKRRIIAAAAIGFTWATWAESAPAVSMRPVTLTLSGRSNGRTDMTLNAPLTIARSSTPLTTNDCGRYAGFFLTRLDDPSVAFGYVDVAAFDFTDLYYRQPVGLGQAAIPGLLGQSQVTLPAGRYRAYLFGEGGRCRVAVPAVGRASISVRTTYPTDVQFATEDATRVLSTGVQAQFTSFPVQVSDATYAVAALHVWHRSAATPATTDSARPTTACLDAVPTTACSPEREITDSVHTYEGRRWPDGSMATADTWFEYAVPGVAPSGATYAKATAASLDGAWHATSALFAFGV